MSSEVTEESIGIGIWNSNCTKDTVWNLNSSLGLLKILEWIYLIGAHAKASSQGAELLLSQSFRFQSALVVFGKHIKNVRQNPGRGGENSMQSSIWFSCFGLPLYHHWQNPAQVLQQLPQMATSIWRQAQKIARTKQVSTNVRLFKLLFLCSCSDNAVRLGTMILLYVMWLAIKALVTHSLQSIGGFCGMSDWL